MENSKTMNIRDYAKMWGIGHDTLRKIIRENPDFPCLRIGAKTAKRQKVLVIIEDADLWMRRNMK